MLSDKKGVLWYDMPFPLPQFPIHISQLPFPKFPFPFPFPSSCTAKISFVALLAKTVSVISDRLWFRGRNTSFQPPSAQDVTARITEPQMGAKQRFLAPVFIAIMINLQRTTARARQPYTGEGPWCTRRGLKTQMSFYNQDRCTGITTFYPLWHLLGIE